MAVVLVDGVARCVSTLNANQRRWFSPPSPEATRRELMAAAPLELLTPVSANPNVGGLTESLRRYIGEHGLRSDFKAHTA